MLKFMKGFEKESKQREKERLGGRMIQHEFQTLHIQTKSFV
jgi:hypothetical protein